MFLVSMRWRFWFSSFSPKVLLWTAIKMCKNADLPSWTVLFLHTGSVACWRLCIMTRVALVWFGMMQFVSRTMRWAGELLYALSEWAEQLSEEWNHVVKQQIGSIANGPNHVLMLCHINENLTLKVIHCLNIHSACDPNSKMWSPSNVNNDSILMNN